MRIGVPKETKESEARVGLVPGDVAILAADGHEVRVQSGAGVRVAEPDDAYRAAGARIVSPAEAWEAELVVKVKELQDADFANVRGPQAIFCFHHLLGEPQRTPAPVISHEPDKTPTALFAPLSPVAG